MNQIKSNVFEKGYALVCGMGGDLPGTVRDAEMFADVLCDRERCGYPKDNVTLLTSDEATAAAMSNALASYRNISKDATLILYYSGHGVRQKEAKSSAFYFCTAGFDKSKLDETAFSGEAFASALDLIPAKQIVLILDCCHAGSMTVTKGDDTVACSRIPPEAMQSFSAGRGRFILSSCREHEVSFTGHPCSPYTAALIEALCGAGAARQDGLVYFTDLFGYTSSKVPQLTQNRQHPTADFHQGDNIAMAYYAAGAATRKGSVVDLEQLSVEGLPSPPNTLVADVPSVVFNNPSIQVGRDLVQAGRDVIIDHRNPELTGRPNSNSGATNDARLRGQETSFERPFSGESQNGFYERLGDSWLPLANLLEIPQHVRATWQRGLEADGIWKWLEYRNALRKLPTALPKIGRTDMKDLFDSGNAP